MPLTGAGVADSVAFTAGECVLLSGESQVQAEPGCDWRLAYPGAQRVPGRHFPLLAFRPSDDELESA